MSCDNMTPYPGWQFIHDRLGAVHHLPTAATIREMQKHIAALEAALKHAYCPHRASAISVGECIDVGWCGIHQKCENCQALTSSEGAGECPHSCVKRSGKRMIEVTGPASDPVWAPCPIHSPNSAAEGQKNG